MSYRLSRLLQRLLKHLLREKLLLALIFVYVILAAVDSGFVFRSPFYVDLDSMSIIVSMLLISRGVEFSGLFSRLSVQLLSLARSPRLLAVVLILAVELSSAVLMNDTSLFIFLPFLLALSRVASIDVELMAVLVTIAANVGSSLTPIGNPQNIIIWEYYGVGFFEFVAFMAPLVAFASLVLIAAACLSFRETKIATRPPPPVVLDRRLFAVSLVLFALLLVALRTAYVPFIVVACFVAMLAVRREIVFKVDYALILMFIFMFMDFREISLLLSGHVSLSSGIEVLVFSALLSQAISNVPATITLLGHVSSWRPLALGVNIGGVGLVTGSMANLITLRLTGLDINKFHKYSIPFFAALLAFFLLLFRLGIYP